VEAEAAEQLLGTVGGPPAFRTTLPV